MTGTELGTLLGAVAVIGVFLLIVRRASMKNRRPAAEPVQPQASIRVSAGRTPQRDEQDHSLESEDEEDHEEDADEDSDPNDELGSPTEDVGDDAQETERLRKGLSKTRLGFVAKLGQLFTRKRIDEDVLLELEETLFSADIGRKATERLSEAIRRGLSRAELSDSAAVWSKIREESATILNVDAKPLDFAAAHPFVLLTIGVNGVGKTTTIGKIAAKLSGEGRKVLLAAGDTFRAAAVEQLEVWGKRAGVPVVKGKANSDPSSVIFDAIRKGVDEEYDVVIADTAGRLHTKSDLMEELGKIGRVCGKAMDGAPHETWLVLDSTTGQNAIQQAEIFRNTVDITGIILTKLDGTAKGGVILGICGEMNVPVRYIGIGEGVEDLREFDAFAFVDALFGDREAVDAA